MKHQGAQALESLYGHFKKGNFPAFLSECADQITFQVPGKSKLAGKYDKLNFESGFVTKLKELSGGTLEIDVHDILASDRHAVALVSEKFMRNGKPQEYRAVHVWRFENGKPVAWYEYPRDLYQFDSFWV